MKGLGVWWMASLLSVTSIAAAGSGSQIKEGLVEAARLGDKAAVRSLLKQHADVNARQADGATALVWAAERDDLETAELLISAGANVNAANDYGVTPLSLACTNGSAAMVGKLLQGGADPNAARWTGETPLMRCARTGNVEAVKSLLSQGADANGRETRQGQTALMWAVAAKRPEIVRLLIERGADAKVRSKSGFTPLMFAAQQGDLDSAQILLGAGANVNAATVEGDTALLVASASGQEALAIFLLDKGADPNAAGPDGVTALHYSVIKGLAIMGGILIRPFEVYLDRPSMLELVKALLVHGANPNARIQKAIGDKLARPGGPVIPGVASPIGATPFLLAAASYDASVMRVLAAGGADPLLATTVDQLTPLMVAAGLSMTRNSPGGGQSEYFVIPHDRAEAERREALEAVKLAVELGNDVNATNNLGQTALHGAAFNGSDMIIQFLAEKGANLNAKDQAGHTPLHVAMKILPEGRVPRNLIPLYLYQSSADLLLKLGATPFDAPVAQGSEARSATAAQ
jgi:uncharacterized protein